MANKFKFKKLFVILKQCKLQQDFIGVSFLVSHVIAFDNFSILSCKEVLFSERLVLNTFCLAQKMWVVENTFWMYYHYDTTVSRHDTYLGVTME